MRMNRRNVLVGLGTIVAGGGAALGTGAFSRVEADRTVDVTVAGDANAFVSLEANNNLTTSAVSQNDGTLAINLSDLGSGSGVNYNATTTVGTGDGAGVDTHAFTITNNGGDPIDLSVDVLGDGDGDEAHLALYAEDSAGNVIDLTSTNYDSNGNGPLGTGSTLYVVVAVELKEEDASSLSDTNIADEIRITATATSA